MKTMRQLCVASMLILTLALVTFAGDIHTGVTNPPPPSGGATSWESDTAGAYGEMQFPNDEEAVASDPVVEAALSLVRTVLALF